MRLGTQIYTDEFGTPYVRIRSWSFDDPNHQFWSGYKAGAPELGFLEYLPKWPADPNYPGWPAWLRAIVPEEWSGDFTRGGWASGFKEDAGLLGAQMAYVDPVQATFGVEDTARSLYYVMRVCGWGRWAGGRSSKDGKRHKCEMRTGLDFGAAFEAAGDLFRYVGGRFGALLRGIAKLVSFIPGIGTVAAAVLAGIGSLAAGEPLDAAVLDAVVNAIPGGGLAKDVMKVGVAAAQKLIEGGNIGDAALAGMRTALEQQGIPVAALDCKRPASRC